MLSRSVPFYDEVRRLIISLILAEEADGKKVLDLGSSTAKFLLELSGKMQAAMQLKGIDNSQAMLDRARQKSQAFGAELEKAISEKAFIDASINYLVPLTDAEYYSPALGTILYTSIEGWSINIGAGVSF
jgi:tRNA (cmo5U34)-methyltransferase